MIAFLAVTTAGLLGGCADDTGDLGQSEAHVTRPNAPGYAGPPVWLGYAVSVMEVPYRAPADDGGSAPIAFELRRKKDLGEWNVVMRASCPSLACSPSPSTPRRFIDASVMALPATYMYQVRAVYPEPDTYSAWSGTIAGGPAVPSWHRRAESVKVVLVRSSNSTELFTREYVHNRIFGYDLSDSVVTANEVIAELTGGAGRVPGDPAVTFTGTVEPWYVIPRTHAQIMAEYGPPPGGPPVSYKAAYKLWLEAHASDEYADWFGTDEDHIILVIEPGQELGGANNGRPIIISARAFLDPPGVRPGAALLAHEIMHNRGLQHTQLSVCAAGPYPSPVSPADYATDSAGAPCQVTGDQSYDLMHVAGDAVHLSAYQKVQTGLFTGKVAWINLTEEAEADEYGHTQYDLSTIGSSAELNLYDHVTNQATDAEQLAVVKTDTSDSSFLLDFRQSVGLNATARTGAVPQGVHIAFRPGISVAWNENPRLDLVYPSTGVEPKPVVLTEERPRYFDSNRCLQIELVQDRDSHAVLRFERTCHPRLLPTQVTLDPDQAVWAQDENGVSTWSSDAGEIAFSSVAGTGAGGINGAAAIGQDNPPSNAAGYQSTGGEAWFKGLHDGTGGTFVMVFDANSNQSGILFDSTRGRAHKTGFFMRYIGSGALQVKVSNGSGSHLIDTRADLGGAPGAVKPHFAIFRYGQNEQVPWSLFVDDGDTPAASGATNGMPSQENASYSPSLLALTQPSSRTSPFDGFIGEMIYVPRHLNDGEVRELSVYLKAKYAINNAQAVSPGQLFDGNLHSWWRGANAAEELWTANESGVTASATPGQELLPGTIGSAPAIGYDAPEAAADGFLTDGKSGDFNFLHDGTGSTFAMVVQANAVPVTKYYLFDETKARSSEIGVTAFLTAKGKLDVRISNGTNGTYLIHRAVQLANPTDAHFFIVRFDASKATPWQLFIDQGYTPAASSTLRGTPSSANATWSAGLLGKATGAGGALDGMVGDILLVDRWATDDEVASLAAYFRDTYGITP